MRKSHFISIILAVALCLAGCQSKNVDVGQAEQTNETSRQAAEETTAPTESVNAYETLAEGQERDWKIEDVLKNDLEIDGIPISVPCTVGELLDMLGKNYSFDEDGSLYYKGEKTILFIYNSNEDNIENCIVRGFHSKYYLLDKEEEYNTEKGIITFTGFNNSPDYLKFINNYTLPNEMEVEYFDANNETTIGYIDENCYMDCIFRNNDLSSLFIGYLTGGNEN